MAGVKVGQVTLVEGQDVRTGVTAILPHGGNIFQDKVPAGISVANGYGKLTGVTQVRELGTLETPIVLTNTLSVPTAADAVIDWTLGLPGNERVASVNPVVGETNDGWLNDIRGRHVTKAHVLEAIRDRRRRAGRRRRGRRRARARPASITRAASARPRAACPRRGAATRSASSSRRTSAAS